eukprot:5793672-Prymnesium_polylepis.1
MNAEPRSKPQPRTHASLTRVDAHKVQNNWQEAVKEKYKQREATLLVRCLNLKYGRNDHARLTGWLERSRPAAGQSRMRHRGGGWCGGRSSVVWRRARGRGAPMSKPVAVRAGVDKGDLRLV